MKKTLIILMLGLFSCKSGKTNITMNKGEAMLHYSKGPCLGDRCPVYDLWIFPDGSYLYKTPKGALTNREKSGSLSKVELDDIQETMKSGLENPTPFNRVRDIPITTLAYGGKIHKYHASRTKGKLMEMNAKLEDLVKILLKE